MFSLAKRGLAAAGLTAALAGAMAAPAAAEPNIEFGVHLSDVILVPGTEGQSVMPLLFVSEETKLKNLIMKVDFSGVAKIASVTPDDSLPGAEDCKVKDTILTCTVDVENAEWGVELPALVIAPLKDAKADDTGDLVVTITSEGIEDAEHTAQVIIGEGVDLAAGPNRELSAAPGKDFGTKLEVGNVGEKAANGTVALFLGSEKLTAGAKRFSNCFYFENELRFCAFEESLEAGKNYITAQDFSLALAKDAKVGEKEGSWIVWQTADEWGLVVKMLTEIGATDDLGTPGTADPLKLVGAGANKSAQTDTNVGNNASVLTVNVIKADSGNGGGLPVTGVNTGIIAAAGGALLLAGAAVFMLARRRRVTIG